MRKWSFASFTIEAARLLSPEAANARHRALRNVLGEPSATEPARASHKGWSNIPSKASSLASFAVSMYASLSTDCPLALFFPRKWWGTHNRLRYPVGVRPDALRNAAVKEPVSLNHSDKQISVTDSVRSANRIFARTRRLLAWYRCGGMPKDCLKALQKWCGLSRTS